MTLRRKNVTKMHFEEKPSMVCVLRITPPCTTWIFYGKGKGEARRCGGHETRWYATLNVLKHNATLTLACYLMPVINLKSPKNEDYLLWV